MLDDIFATHFQTRPQVRGTNHIRTNRYNRKPPHIRETFKKPTHSRQEEPERKSLTDYFSQIHVIKQDFWLFRGCPKLVVTFAKYQLYCSYVDMNADRFATDSACVRQLTKTNGSPWQLKVVTSTHSPQVECDANVWYIFVCSVINPKCF